MRNLRHIVKHLDWKFWVLLMLLPLSVYQFYLLASVLGGICLYLLGQSVVRWLRKLPVTPDPWDGRLSLQGKDSPVPPIHPPGNHGMKKVLTSMDLSGLDVNLLKGLLEQEGIPCMIRNEDLTIAIGELPPAECYQELWLLDVDDYPRAKEIYESWKTATPLPIEADT